MKYILILSLFSGLQSLAAKKLDVTLAEFDQHYKKILQEKFCSDSPYSCFQASKSCYQNFSKIYQSCRERVWPEKFVTVNHLESPFWQQFGSCLGTEVYKMQKPGKDFKCVRPKEF